MVRTSGGIPFHIRDRSLNVYKRGRGDFAYAMNFSDHEDRLPNSLFNLDEPRNMFRMLFKKISYQQQQPDTPVLGMKKILPATELAPHFVTSV